jgi:hypothetical protein
VQFGSKAWCDAQDERQIEIEQQMRELRPYARTVAQREALDYMLDAAKEQRTRIAGRKAMITKMTMMVR